MPGYGSTSLTLGAGQLIRFSETDKILVYFVPLFMSGKYTRAGTLSQNGFTVRPGGFVFVTFKIICQQEISTEEIFLDL